ncbi:MAG: type IV pili methyl-accepting chemotaxis transducer N-terminal domain-containing protein [Myxococcota bacterium]
MLSAALLVLLAGPAPAQILPWEVTVAEIEAGRLRGLAQRLAKQNLLYQLRLGEVRKPDLIETSDRIDRVIASLEKGSPSYSVPAPWTPEIRAQLAKVDAAWGPMRRIATASAYDTFRVSREFVPREDRRGDPLLLRYFDRLADALVEESEVLLAIYHDECEKTGLEVCPVARDSGYASMLMERAAKEAVKVIADIDGDASRKQLNATIEAYRELRIENQKSPFFAAAIDPTRGLSAQAAGELLESQRSDWDAMQAQFRLLAAGDEENFDLPGMLLIHERLVDKTERVTAAFVRYASLAYGS